MPVVTGAASFADTCAGMLEANTMEAAPKSGPRLRSVVRMSVFSRRVWSRAKRDELHYGETVYDR
jgi:hypothetical protein